MFVLHGCYLTFSLDTKRLKSTSLSLHVANASFQIYRAEILIDHVCLLSFVMSNFAISTQ